MCTQAKLREEMEGWILDGIIEERGRRTDDAKKRNKERSEGGWMDIFRMKKKTPQCFDNNAEAETNELDCFLCQKIVDDCEHDMHLEKHHRVLFSLKEIKKASKKDESVALHGNPDHQNEETELEVIRTDAVTVKELVEMKYLPKKKKIKIRTATQRLFSRKYKVLTEEVFINLVDHNIYLPFIIFSCRKLIPKIMLQKKCEKNLQKDNSM